MFGGGEMMVWNRKKVFVCSLVHVMIQKQSQMDINIQYSCLLVCIDGVFV